MFPYLLLFLISLGATPVWTCSRAPYRSMEDEELLNFSQIIIWTVFPAISPMNTSKMRRQGFSMEYLTVRMITCTPGARDLEPQMLLGGQLVSVIFLFFAYFSISLFSILILSLCLICRSGPKCICAWNVLEGCNPVKPWAGLIDYDWIMVD